MSDNLPIEVTKYFWGDDLNELNWKDHKRYISQTLLEKGDWKSIGWLCEKLSRKEILNTLNEYKLTEKSRNFWQIYLS